MAGHFEPKCIEWIYKGTIKLLFLDSGGNNVQVRKKRKVNRKPTFLFLEPGGGGGRRLNM